jgi:hypothetical protein
LVNDEKETSMRRIFALIIAVGLMAAVLALPGTAIGRATHTAYIGTETQTGGPTFPEPLKGNLPVERTTFESVFADVTFLPNGTTPYLPATGDTFVSGVLIITETVEPLPDLFPGFFVPFNGSMHGTSVTVVPKGSETAGTWVGRWQGKLVNGVGFYKAVAHGTGDFAGMKMKLTFTGDQPYPIEGRILDPHGS